MALRRIDWPGLAVRRGKARDVVDLEDGRLLIVATDRISAFDWVLHDPIPDKGRVLNGLSAFWFERLGVVNHMISTNPEDARLEIPEALREELVGRSMIVRKARVVPFECVVRGYLAGSGWKEYRTRGTVCGETLAQGLVESDRIEPAVFTPATKAETGHDENVSFASMADAIGFELADSLREKSLAVYQNAAEYARKRGLILADTKFEWGIAEDNGELLLIDEALTPDSSRYWPLDGYRPGGPQPSFDKQFVRDWLETSGWDKASEPPKLPEEVVNKTREKYIQAYEILTEKGFLRGEGAGG